jgi:hypothetical protein
MLDGERCIRCKERFKFEQLEVGPDGFGICHACSEKIKGADEPRRHCPVDDSEMDKAFLRNIVLVDRCPKCKGIWFDGDELEIVEQGMRADNFANLMLISMIGAI